MLYRVLVVEDDNNIRKGLVKIISNMELPIESIYEAENGQHALKILGQQRPDIIITDIRMPAMNGLDFIEQVKASGSNARFVILSGYSEFSYAQRAISYNVFEYLLKPVKKGKLYQTLVKLMEQVKQETDDKEQKLKNDKKLQEYHSVILKEVLEGYQTSNNIDYIFSNAGVAFKKTGFAICSFYCKSNTDLIKDLLEQNSEYLNICFKYISRYNHIICLVNLEILELSNACSLLKRRMYAFADENKVYAYSGISEWSDNTAKLVELVKEAEKALDYRLLNNSDLVFLYSDIKKNTRLKPSLNAYYEEIFNAMNIKDMKGLSLGIDRMFDFLQKLSPFTPGLFKNSIACYILYYMPSGKQDLITGSISSIEDIYQSSDSLFDFKMHIKQLFHSICKKENEDSASIYTNKIHSAIKYLETNYTKNLSLDEVAGHININASYFSNIFKKETGMYFSDYLQNIRIEKSKSLLMQPCYKVYEIAESVGFMDEKYYFKVFKKLTGITPNQYRNGIQRPE